MTSPTYRAKFAAYVAEQLEDIESQIPKCPGCGLPGHATETDDDGYHPGCREEEPSK